jgi:SAM-dependent methyltransferase
MNIQSLNKIENSSLDLNPIPVKQQSIETQIFHHSVIHQEPVSRFREVFKKEAGQRAEFRQFLSNVFMQLNEDKFFALMDSILENESLTDEQIYEQLSQKIGQAKDGTLTTLLAVFRSLRELKKDLSDQVKQVMGSQKINGYTEIGYPGRLIRPLKSKLEMNGPMVVVNDKESLTDYIQTGFPRPYHRFVPLRDFEPIVEEQIASSSMDMVSCFIGLHHTPEDKLNAFVQSIHRVLRPGGSFILMDHDVKDQKLDDLAHVVHSVFNAATGVSPEEEKQECRRFRSLADWTELLKRHGFERVSEPLMRHGDSTLNSVVRFKKIPQGRKEIEEYLANSPDYSRDQVQTYLTSPEWHNVRLAKGYAKALKEKPFYQYSYFKEIGNTWKVFGNTWNVARRDTSIWQLLKTDFTLMNVFISTTVTVEFLLKGLFSLPLSLLSKERHAEDLTRLEKHYAQILENYSKFIDHTPFYQYPYFTEMGSAWKELAAAWKEAKESQGFFSFLASKETWMNVLMTLFMTAEFLAKGIVSAPCNWLYGSGDLQAASTIHLLVDDKEGKLDSVDERIKVVESFPDAHLKHIEIPRYLPCTDILNKLSDKGIECVNIAGQKKVQLDVRLKPGQGAPSCGNYLYEMPDPSHADQKYVTLEVEVDQLKEVLPYLKQNQFTVEYIHDF